MLKHSLPGKSHSAEKKNKNWSAIAELKNPAFPPEMGEDEWKLSLLRFYSALAILEPQNYVVVEQFGAENISLLTGRLVYESVFVVFSIREKELMF